MGLLESSYAVARMCGGATLPQNVELVTDDAWQVDV